MDQLTYVFIAGPYAGETHDYRSYLEIEANIARARSSAAQLARAGVPFYCPHLNCAHFEVIVPGLPDEFWYELDNVFLRNAAAVYLLDGWQRSTGTLAEVELATELSKPVYLPAGFDELVDDWHKARALLCGTEGTEVTAEKPCCLEHSCPHHDGLMRDEAGEWYNPHDLRERHRFGR